MSGTGRMRVHLSVKSLYQAERRLSYAGREPDEGKKITWRDGFAALRALVKYRFTKQ